MIREAGGLVVLHDWSSITKVDSDARQHIDASWKANVKPGDLDTVITAMDLNPFVRMAFSVIHLGVSLLEGATARNELVPSVEPYLAEFGVTRPDPGEPLEHERALLARRDAGEKIDATPP